MGLLEDVLGSELNGAGSSKAKKAKKQPATTPIDGVIDSVDDAVKSKLPKGAVTDMAESALDQNKDGHIVDDVLNLAQNLFKKK